MEADLDRVLQKGMVWVVDFVVEISELTFGICRVKVACVAAGIERGK